MSNQKKREQQRKNEAAFEESVGKRDKEIVGAYRAGVQAGMPFDRKEGRAFFSGAVWADKHPATSTKLLYITIGAVMGIISCVFGAITGALITL